MTLYPRPLIRYIGHKVSRPMSTDERGVTLSVQFTVNPGAIVDSVGFDLSGDYIADKSWGRKLVSESSAGEAIFEMTENSERLGQVSVEIKGQTYQSEKFNWKSTFGR